MRVTIANDKYVLDYGCGRGYGAALVSNYADTIIGVDINKEVINYCNKTHSALNLSFEKIDPNYLLPFEDKFFDVIVSFQVIEHIPEVQRYLFELKRVLKDGGVLFITTPNRKHRLLPLQKPWNPEHIREYSLRLLYEELIPVFKKVKVLGVYGTEEINSIEYNRVKQTLLGAYAYKPAKKLLKAVLPSRVIEFLGSLKRNIFSQVKSVSGSVLELDLPSQYSLEGFTVGNNVDICLDFFASCHKE